MAIDAFLSLLLLTTPTAGDSVYGVVRDAVTGDALPGVTVAAAAAHQTLTNDRGAYVIPAPDPGLHQLRFTRSGFEEFEVDVAVPTRRSLRLDVALDPVPVTLPPVSVTSPPTAAADEIQGPDGGEIGLRRYTAETLRSNPMVSPNDPLLAAAGGESADAQPGALRPLRVRGGSGDQNLVLLDGLPVYGLAHLGGIAAAFDPDLLGRVDLHTAAPPAAYTGRLSSVLDVHLRPPDPRGVHLSGAWDQVAVRQSLNAPLGPGGGALQVSVRRSYRGLFPGDIRDAEQNGFGDALVHASFGSSRDRFAGYFIDGSDHLVFSTLPVDQERGNGFDWSHRTTGLVWRHETDGRHVVTARAWDSRADAEIVWGVDGAPETVTSAMRDRGASIEISPSDPDAPAMLGLSVSRPSTSYALTSTIRASSGGAAAPTRPLSAAPLLVGVFGQGRWRVGPQGTLSAGLRINSVDLRGALLEPRVSGRFDLGRHLVLLAGYSRIHQFVQSLRNEESLLDHAVGAELLLAVGAAGLQPARADQLSGALVSRLDGRSTFRVDAYARSLRSLLIIPAGTTGPFARESTPSGSGSARGVNVELDRHGARLDLRLALGTEGSQRHVDGESFAPGALRSHWLSAGAGYHLDDRTVLRLAGSVASGAATTLVRGDVAWDAPGILSVGGEIAGSPEALAGALNRNRLPVYWRVDAGLVHDWRVFALGKPGVLTTSITLANLFDTRNPLGYAAGANAGARRALYFPSRTLGVQVGWRF